MQSKSPKNIRSSETSSQKHLEPYDAYYSDDNHLPSLSPPKNIVPISKFREISFRKSIKAHNSKEKSLSLPKIIVNEKYFKINEKVKHYHIKQKPSMSICLNEHAEKMKLMAKLESHHVSTLTEEETSNKQILIKEFLSKIDKNNKNELKKLSESQIHGHNLTEEDLLILVEKFYRNKIVKSKCLMKYFNGKYIEGIIKTMCQYIYNLIFSSVETNRTAFEHLENIHRELCISNEDYDTFKGLFVINMRENLIPEEDVQIYIENFEKFRYFITKKLKYDQIALDNKVKFDDFIVNFHEAIKENGILSLSFAKMPDEVAIDHHKKLFNYVCQGYSDHCLFKRKESKNKEIHQKIGVSWYECFEMKNLLFNQFLDKKTLVFNDQFQLFRNNLQNLHKFFLEEPNQYVLKFHIDFKTLVNSFTNAIKKHKGLNDVFWGFNIERLIKHSEYMINFLMNSKHNHYQLNDLAAAHCKHYINNQEFSQLFHIFSSVLQENQCNSEEIMHLQGNFHKTQNYISQEQQIYDKIGGIECVDNFIEIMYISLFGSNETKNYFKNYDMENIKYKQKIFFSKLFKNEIDSVDLVDLKAIHEKLEIREKHFDSFIKFASETLIALRINEKLIPTILEKIQFLKPSICKD